MMSGIDFMIHQQLTHLFTQVKKSYKMIMSLLITFASETLLNQVLFGSLQLMIQRFLFQLLLFLNTLLQFMEDLYIFYLQALAFNIKSTVMNPIQINMDLIHIFK